jgi:sulfur carrier protein
MKIIVNGIEKEFENEKLPVVELLKLSEVSNVDMVSVQLNGKFLKKESFIDTELTDNDKVDFLYFMGGGQDFVGEYYAT